MSRVRLLADEHIPGPFFTARDALEYDVLRARDEFPEGTPDRRLIEFGRETDRVVVTCDTRFAVVDGSLVTGPGSDVRRSDVSSAESGADDRRRGLNCDNDPA